MRPMMGFFLFVGCLWMSMVAVCFSPETFNFQWLRWKLMGGPAVDEPPAQQVVIYHQIVRGS